MMETEALDLILASEIDRSKLQAMDESFWSIEHLNKAAAELAALKSRLAEAEDIISSIEHSGRDHDEAVCPCCNSEIGEVHTGGCPIRKFLEEK